MIIVGSVEMKITLLNKLHYKTLGMSIFTAAGKTAALNGRIYFISICL